MDNKFDTLKDIDSFFSFPIDIKITFLKHLAQTVPYNKDLQLLPFSKNLFVDLTQFIQTSTSSDKNFSREILITSRLLFMNLNNCVVDNTKSQQSYFQQLWNDNFSTFESVALNFIDDLKVLKFLLSSVYNSIVMNDENLKSLKIAHIILINKLLVYQPQDKVLTDVQKSDLEEIHHWRYLLIKYILKAKEEFYDGKNLLSFYLEVFSSERETNDQDLILDLNLNQNVIAIFELIRDFLEFKKDNSEVEINIFNLKLLIKYILSATSNLEKIVSLMKSKDFTDFMCYETNSINNISFNFKLYLCLVDIFATILPIQEYREILFSLVNVEEILGLIYSILSQTDYFYDTKFKRKAFKENYEGVPENNVFYTFQTNIFKFLANYFFSNSKAKTYFLKPENNLKFYYLLNHMKVDKSNPFKKEWAVLVVKALCEESHQIQQMILDLKANDVDPFLKEYLLKNNYDFKLDKENYKLHINKKD